MYFCVCIKLFIYVGGLVNVCYDCVCVVICARVFISKHIIVYIMYYI